MAPHPQHETSASVPHRRLPRFRRLLIRFRRNREGATIVEFAMVATPFFMLMFAIMETALMFWTSQVLDELVTEASRKLLTGESQFRTNPAQDFRSDICNDAPALIDCDSLQLDVRTYTSFANADRGTTSPLSGGTLNTSGFGYAQPQPGQIVVVRAVIRYPILLNRWNSALVNLEDSGERALIATVAFRAEPFTAPST